jgi:hypothetical protein
MLDQIGSSAFYLDVVAKWSRPFDDAYLDSECAKVSKKRDDIFVVVVNGAPQQAIAYRYPVFGKAWDSVHLPVSLIPHWTAIQGCTKGDRVVGRARWWYPSELGPEFRMRDFDMIIVRTKKASRDSVTLEFRQLVSVV